MAAPKQKVDLPVGDPVKYIGMGDKRYTCPVCSRSIKRGFFYQKPEGNACSRKCLNGGTK